MLACTQFHWKNRLVEHSKMCAARAMYVALWNEH
jgi:hypothetical protein